jgi:drug/metabolite transporter (DMT)-like permease
VLVGLVAAAGAAVLFGVAAVLQALATAGTVRRDALDPRLLLELLRSRAFLLCLAGNLAGFGLHVLALQFLPLFLVQAVVAASVVVTAVLGARILRERLHRVERAAVLGVFAGLALLALAAGEGSAEPASPLVVPGLALTLVAVAAVGAVLAGRAGDAAAGPLGLLAGVGFAVVAVAARLLPDLTPSTLVTSPTAWLVPAAGALAFLLYAHALQRGSVTRTTAAMVLTQTALPAVVGVLLLGDHVRPGLPLVGLVGLPLALTGVVVLIARERPLERPAGQPAQSTPGSSSTLG